MQKDILTEWLSKPETLDFWTKNFRSLTATLEDKTIITEELIQEENERVDASRAYKTPKKLEVSQIIKQAIPLRFEPPKRETESLPEDFMDKYAAHLNATI